MKLNWSLAAATILFLTGCNGQNNQQTVHNPATQLAEQLDIKYSIVTNRTDDNCDKKQTDGKCFEAKLQLKTTEDIALKNWTIYFSNMAPVQMDDSDLFDIRHINGDLHSITPTSKFNQFNAGTVYDINFKAGFWHLSQTDMMPNYFVVVGNNDPVTINSTKPIINPETGLEHLPHSVPLTLADKHFKRTENDLTQPATATWLYEENQPFYADVDVTNSILPTPKSVIQPRMAGNLNLSSGLKVERLNISESATEAALTRLASMGVKQNNHGIVTRLELLPELDKEEYQLQILPNKIEIQAGSDVGAFYALQSIASLLMPDSLSVPYLVIKDEPRYEFRGMHMDVSRNFKSKAFILQVLDQMAAYKLNKFHFHLADDEGWRVEIPGLPELTEVGAFRCHDRNEQHCLLPQLGAGPEKNSEVNGYYSVADYQEILAYAAARHIQVIPSMDMPGHSRAAIKSMAARHAKYIAQGKVDLANEFLLHDIEDATEYQSIQFYSDNTINVCLDSSYDFVSKIVDELAVLHKQANNPLTRYHIGADETAGAWVNSSACKNLLENNVLGITNAEGLAAHFVEKVSRLLASKGIEAAGWNDGMGHTNPERMPEKVQSNAWTPLAWEGHKAAHEQANRGWEVVVSSPDALYFDFPYEADANERGYYWAARRTNTRKVFNFMPDNLPANAEVMKGREEHPYVADDTKSMLNSGVRFQGMQGNFWAETVRTDRQASYMIFPRLYALAERAWHQAEWEVPYDYQGKKYQFAGGHFTEEMNQARTMDWQRFANHLGKKTLVKAESQQLFFRLPTAGAKLKENLLHMNSLFPGLNLEYKESDGEWQTYSVPVKVTPPIEVRTATTNSPRKSRSLVVAE